jgi:hypothetical protein
MSVLAPDAGSVAGAGGSGMGVRVVSRSHGRPPVTAYWPTGPYVCWLGAQSIPMPLGLDASR